MKFISLKCAPRKHKHKHKHKQAYIYTYIHTHKGVCAFMVSENNNKKKDEQSSHQAYKALYNEKY